MYKEIAARTALVKAWDASVLPGTTYTVTDAGKAVCAHLPPYKSWLGYRGQSVARILVEHFGWERHGRMLVKPIHLADLGPDEVI